MSTEQQLQSEIKLKTIQLHWLLQITKAVNYNLPAEQLFNIYKSVLQDHLRVNKLLLFVYETHWQQILSYGIDYHHFNIDAENDFNHLNEYTPGNKKAPQWLREFETIIPVIHNQKPLAYAFIGGFSDFSASQKKEIIPFIHTITNIIVVAIENKRLSKESIRQATLEKELELAAEMQALLLPEDLDGYGVFEVEATYLPHQEVGGDFYDYFRLNENESLVCMADVSGKGMAAALLSSNFQANLRALAAHTSDLCELIKILNEKVFQNAKGEKYITVFIGVINHDSKQIRYVNAGHNPPVLVSQKQVHLLEKGTTGLGMFEKLPFLNEGEIHFPTNAMLFCYTDGITELEDASGNFFGMDNFKKAVVQHSPTTSSKLFHSSLLDALNIFRKDILFNDDVTLLTIKSI